MPPRAFIKGLDHSAPSLVLGVVDLTQIQDLPLHHLAAGAALALDNIPVATLFPVFEASIEPQEHANQPTTNQGNQKGIWSTLQLTSGRAPLIRLAFTHVQPRKIATGPHQLRKSG